MTITHLLSRRNRVAPHPIAVAAAAAAVAVSSTFRWRPPGPGAASFATIATESAAIARTVGRAADEPVLWEGG